VILISPFAAWFSTNSGKPSRAAWIALHAIFRLKHRMQKHRGLPEFMYGSNIRIAIRRDAKEVTPLRRRERDYLRPPEQSQADAFTIGSLYKLYQDQPFVRGNIDAGRINWLLGREIVAADAKFSPVDYDTLLKINVPLARKNFPGAFS
jgi:hypothetical protein